MGNKLNVGITGASGHIGHNLVVRMLELGYKPKILIHNNDSLVKDPKLNKFSGNIKDSGSMHNFCKDLDVVIHLAAVISIGGFSTKEVFETNLEGTKTLLNAAMKEGIKRFIHISSIHALKHEPLEEAMDETRELALDSWLDYERSKARSEKWVLEQNSDSFNVVVLNPTSVIGPEDHQPSLMGELLQMSYEGKIPGVIPGGYDWVDVRDIVNGIISSIDLGESGNRYILSGNWHTIKELTDTFLEISDKSKKLPVLPLWLAKLGIPFLYIFSKITGNRPLFGKESLYILQNGNNKISNKKAQKQLNYSTRPLKDTLEDTYSWFKQMKYI